jgi:starch-binding outer membrane protein, SusD/RagB family
MHYNIHQHISRVSKGIVALVIMVLTCTTGCKKFVEVQAPKSQLLGPMVFQEKGTAVAALSGVYSHLRSDAHGLLYVGSWGMPSYMAQYTDEIVNYSNTNAIYGEDFYKNLLFPDAEDIRSLWTTAYNQIYNVNAIIEGLDNSVALTEDEKAQVKGEAIFVRALLHFYLVNLFGDVPYITSTDYLVNKDLSRTPSATVYDLVIKDLQTAAEQVGEQYPSAERVRPNKSVVRALMARVYLYKQDWANAEAMATAVIGNSTYQWVNNLSDVFLKQSTGTIWAFKPSVEGVNSEDASIYILLSNPIPYYRSISSSLLDAFEIGDKRRNEWIGSFSQGGNTWYFPYKYKQRGNTGTSKEYSVILRLEEQYLIRAEARTQLGNITGAQSDLDKIRNRAGLDNTLASTKEEMLDAILHERQVELFTEFGHRFFDLKRMGKADQILPVTKPNWAPKNKLLPIPEKELLVNQNLNPQNLGY